ncbi:YlmH/Sll1252 family protein [Candidatus Izimaplasma bacterium HR1]|uniref:YlmH/Sll1252 family protein n=1 Tax=Candidatus Izimoplasma sp. HR1 TaxID=1541959 RepID=UPI00130EC06E
MRFLNLEEQTYLKKMKECVLNGGYAEAEKKRAYFFNNEEANIVCLKINYNTKYLTLTHQNILGTLLSLGITIDSIGDILPKQGVFFTTKEISKEILTSFNSVNKVSIELTSYNKELVFSEKEFEEYRTTLDSLRLDLVISKICKISRKESNIMIEKELIKLNHQMNKKPTVIIKDNDIISIRKYGRFKIINSNKRSKKGKIVLNYYKYI